MQQSSLTEELTLLNQLTETLNRAVDMQGALATSLAHLIDLMGLKTGWIFLVAPLEQDRWHGRGYTLAAHHNLPPVLDLENPAAWSGGCDCQGLCNKHKLTDAYNEVRCSRLADMGGDSDSGLTVHASVPLRSGENVLGILNIAAEDWSAFTPRSLALLTNVGHQMGIAMERARLFDLVREKRSNEQRTLLNFSNQLLAHRNLESQVDFLVEEARRSLQVDACALLLPDEAGLRLYFSAASGWNGSPVRENRSVPNDDKGGPGQVMHHREALLIEDIESSPEQAPMMLEWLRDEGFRGHAIVPLIVEDHAIGTLVVNTREPRLLSRDELRFLRLMANQAALALETARLHQEDLKLQRMREELAISQQIQLSMLPEVCPMMAGWQFAAEYQAARIVGGDFYDFFPLVGEPHHIGIVIADVADKGVPAALFMVLSRTIIRTTALSGMSPSAALLRANRLIINDHRGDTFLTAFYAILDGQSGELRYTNAGHNPPLWYRASTGTFERLSLPGIIIGAFPDIQLNEASIQLEPGDVLVFYTDGVTEAPNEHGEEFRESRLQAVVAGHASESAEEIVEAIVNAVKTFTRDAIRFDDFTLVVVKYAH